jgi:hypothetical protein
MFGYFLRGPGIRAFLVPCLSETGYGPWTMDDGLLLLLTFAL